MNENSTSLTYLACQLGSPYDRHRYTKVIVLSKQLKDQINELKLTIENNKKRCLSNKINDCDFKEEEEIDQMNDDTSSLIHSPTMISSHSSTSSSSSSSIKSPTSFHITRSYSSNYQPQLKQSTSNSKHIDRLSKQYTDINLMNQLLITHPTSSLTTSINNEFNSTPNKLTISTSLSLSTTIKKKKDQNELNGLISPPLSPPSFTSTTFPPRSTSLKPHLASSSSLIQHQPIPSIEKHCTSSKRLSNFYPDLSSPFSPPISPKIETKNDFHCPIITPIQKKNGMKIRSFFGQSILLNKMIRMEQRQHGMDHRFFLGKNELTNECQKILKLNIIYGHHDSCQEMAPFGIYFMNTISFSSSSSSTSFHENNNPLPDSLIIDALNVWLNKLKLPHLSSASHILRDSTKLYIVYHEKI